MSERIYDIDGLKLPSVTTILGCLHKPALVPWAAKLTAETFKQLIETEATLTEFSYLVEPDQLEGFADTAKKAHRTKSREAMDIGTQVHEAIQHWIESNGTMKPEEIKDEQTRRGLEGFLKWGEEHDIEIISFEQVVSDKLSYAGRYDLLAKVDGLLTLVDFKTSTGIWHEYWLQVAAYAACIEDNVQATGILRIDKQTGEIEFQHRKDWLQFANAFNLLADFYNLNKKLEGKRGNKN